MQDEHHDDEHLEEVHLSQQQVEALGLRVDTLARRVMEGFIEAKGELTVTPQNEAMISNLIGANIHSVEVIEEEEVKKGQVLAYLYHPDLIQLQVDFAEANQQLEFLQKEFNRQSTLAKESVGAGKEVQRVEADLNTQRVRVAGFKSKLRQLNMDPEQVLSGNLYERSPVLAPIPGIIQTVNIRQGLYVPPGDVLFEVLNDDHVHIHLQVFESDIVNIRNGQEVLFSVHGQPNIEFEAHIISVGNQLEQASKTIGIHAEPYHDEEEGLVSGMYVKAKILTNPKTAFALPKEAVVMENERHYIFQAEQAMDGGVLEWHFKPVEISIGRSDGNWVEVLLHTEVINSQQFAWNSAYYLLAEMNKGDAGHDH
ncbi:MAG: efflux RND transporter periplasmic adaptor subunit [Bacteroidota bacterium]